MQMSSGLLRRLCDLDMLGHHTVQDEYTVVHSLQLSMLILVDILLPVSTRISQMYTEHASLYIRMQLNASPPSNCALQVLTHSVLVLSCIRVVLYLWVVQNTHLSFPPLP